MGLLDIFSCFRKKEPDAAVEEIQSAAREYADSTSIDEAEKHCYQPDEYYTFASYPGTSMARKIITFQERKKTCIPSERGLYVAEILLLEYCRKGWYPNPKDGYPGFWWFQYGIRDVGHALEALAQRGFIIMASPLDSVGSLTVLELKALLRKAQLPVGGRKSDLVKRIQDNFSDDMLTDAKIDCKYQLTELGRQELQDNAYVPYMHSIPGKTTEEGPRDTIFNVWRINQELGPGDKSNWKDIVDKIERDIEERRKKAQQAYMDDLKKIDYQLYLKLKNQDEQLELIKRMEGKLNEDRDLAALIDFWEKLWRNGGLKFKGMYWHFRLPDLYIKAGRYEEAMAFCCATLSGEKYYAEKADYYIRMIEDKISNTQKRKADSKSS